MKNISVKRALEQLADAMEEEIKESEGICYAEHDGYHCIRGKDHSGQHIAKGLKYIYAIWNNQPL